MIKLILITNTLFKNSLIANIDLLKPIKRIFKEFFNLKMDLRKKGIELLREMAKKLANFGLVNDFLLILRTNLTNFLSIHHNFLKLHEVNLYKTSFNQSQERKN